jgi:hypothetical protein
VVQDQVKLQRLNHVKLAFQDVLVLECVHGLILIDASWPFHKVEMHTLRQLVPVQSQSLVGIRTRRVVVKNGRDGRKR